MPVFDMTEKTFYRTPMGMFLHLGFLRLLLMVKVKGLDFQECFDKSVVFDDDDLKIRTIHKNNLIQAKRSSGRAKDLNDLENLV